MKRNPKKNIICSQGFCLHICNMCYLIGSSSFCRISLLQKKKCKEELQYPTENRIHRFRKSKINNYKVNIFHQYESIDNSQFSLCIDPCA
jgi:hypothetical protein